MSTRLTAWAVIVGMIPLFAASSRAADNTPLLKDLTAVIALHGQSCGQVVSAVPVAVAAHVVNIDLLAPATTSMATFSAAPR